MRFDRTRSESDWHDYVEARLSSYLDDQLAENERAQVLEHLQGCERCQASLRSLTWTVTLLKQAPAPALPRQFTLPVPESTPARAASPGWLKWGLSAATAIAAFAGIILVSVAYLSQRSGGEPGVALMQEAPRDSTLIAVAPSQPTAESGAVAGGAAPTLASESVPPAPAAEATTAPATDKVIAPSPAPTQVPAATLPEATLPPGAGGELPTTSTPAAARAASVPQPLANGTITENGVNVRAGPGTRFDAFGQLQKGQKVEVFARNETSEWLQILYPLRNDQNLRAWVSAEFVQLDVAANTLPLAEQIPTPAP